MLQGAGQRVPHIGRQVLGGVSVSSRPHSPDWEPKGAAPEARSSSAASVGSRFLHPLCQLVATTHLPPQVSAPPCDGGLRRPHSCHGAGKRRQERERPSLLACGRPSEEGAAAAAAAGPAAAHCRSAEGQVDLGSRIPRVPLAGSFPCSARAGRA